MKGIVYLDVSCILLFSFRLLKSGLIISQSGYKDNVFIKYDEK